jgi:transcriptional regulator with XRE-family HTH domain
MEQLIFPLSQKEAEARGLTYSPKDNREALFPTRLREERARKGVSQDEFSKSIGVTKSTISLYELGENVPDIKTLVKIADYFEINCNYFLGKSDIRSRDISNEEINTQIGLSDETIKNLKVCKKWNDENKLLLSNHINVLNTILSDIKIYHLLINVSKYAESVKKSKKAENKIEKIKAEENTPNIEDYKNPKNIGELEYYRDVIYNEKNERQIIELWNMQKDFINMIEVLFGNKPDTIIEK